MCIIFMADLLTIEFTLEKARYPVWKRGSRPATKTLKHIRIHTFIKI